MRKNFNQIITPVFIILLLVLVIMVSERISKLQWIFEFSLLLKQEKKKYIEDSLIKPKKEAGLRHLNLEEGPSDPLRDGASSLRLREAVGSSSE